jgi:hypothetical protein
LKTKTVYMTCPLCKGKGGPQLDDGSKMQCPRCFDALRVPYWVPDHSPKKMPGWFRKRSV